MTDAPKHPESLSRRDMIAATAAALVTPLLQGGAVSLQPVAGVPGKFLTAAEYALLDELTELIIPADDHSPGARAAAPDQRVAVLTRMAAGEADPKTAPERFFGELKGWTARGYYTSKIGIHLDQEYKGNVYQRGEFAGYDAK